MTFHNINNQNNVSPNNPAYENMSGRFGNGQNRSLRPENLPVQRRQRNVTNNSFSRFSNISAEGWVDIVCLTIISIFLIAVFLNWNAFLDLLFLNVLFPIVSTGAAIIGILIGVGTVLGILYAKLRHPRRWY